MQKSEKFFIFSWKEIVVIGLLIMTCLGFFFTLGLHYGKKLHPEAPVAEVPAAKMEESPESVPTKDTLEQGSQHVEPAAQEAIKAATDAVIKETDLKVAEPKPVDLPKEKEKPEAKESVVKAEPKKEESNSEEKAEPKGTGAYAIQLGSYPNRKEAQMKIGSLNKRGLKPEIRTAEVKGQIRFRVVLPGYKTKAIADVKAKDLKAKRKIENFVIIKSE